MLSLNIRDIQLDIVNLREQNKGLCCMGYSILKNMGETLFKVRPLIVPKQENNNFYTESKANPSELIESLKSDEVFMRVLSLGDMRTILTQMTKQTMIDNGYELVLIVGGAGSTEIDGVYYDLYLRQGDEFISIPVYKR